MRGARTANEFAGRSQPPSAVHRRLRSLAFWELLNVPLQVTVWFVAVNLPKTKANVTGFAFFAVLLLQGGIYWLFKLRQIRHGLRRLPGLAVFRALRVVNVGGLVGGALVVIPAVVDRPGSRSFPGLVFLFAAGLEHVNYFHVQLMHDTAADVRRLFATGLRRSHLARDLHTLRG